MPVRVRTFYPVPIVTSTIAAGRLAIADTARRMQEITPVDLGDLRAGVRGRERKADKDTGLRAEIAVVGNPIGKVMMRAHGGEIRPKPGRPLVFYSRRTGSWVTIKHPRTVRQRAGGYSQGWQPWLTRAGELFAEAVTARLRQMGAIQPPRRRR